MPRDINTRLSNLRTRRKGIDRVGVLNEAAALDVLSKSFSDEPWQRRAGSQPHTRYALGAMQAVDAAYTQKSIDEAERVAKTLRAGLSQSVETRLQGSVPLDVHIRGVSDVDLLVLETSFLTYATFGTRAGQYAPAPGRTSLSVLKALRAEAETLLKTRYWGAKVDCSGGKCIALSEGAFQRPVDVVPSHWFDTIDYQTSGASHDRGVVILDKAVPTTIDNLPFLHIERVHSRDVAVLGGLKKAIRLLKNVKSDADAERRVAGLPSFDIAALLYHADSSTLTAAYLNELYILLELRRFLDWCWTNKSAAELLRTPDGSRVILNSSAKWDALLALSCEVDDLAWQVAGEQNIALRNRAGDWNGVTAALQNARIPAAA